MAEKIYKQFPKISGIYCYENKRDNKKYIGLAKNLYNRIRQHETNFEMDDFGKTVGENKYLWNSVKCNGRDSFTVYIVETCDIEVLEEKEIFYIKKLESHITTNGYNFLWGGFSRLGTNHSEETKLKISKIHKGKPKSLETRRKMSESAKGKVFSEETRNKISNTKKGTRTGENNPMFGRKGINSPLFGRKAPLEERRKISASKLGVKRPQSVIDKLKLIVGEKHWFFGKHHTDETKEKMSKGMTGKKHGTNGTSKYLGVSFYSKINKWKASITIERKQLYLGVFKNEEDAAKEYDRVSWNYYKDVSKLNFPEDYK